MNKSTPKKSMLLLILLILLSLATTSHAGPWLCAACITSSAAACIAGCAPLGLPPLILSCAMECEMIAAYGVCNALCIAPTP